MTLSAIKIVRSTSAIESGFIAAGVTISIIAALQCIIIVLHWVGLGF